MERERVWYAAYGSNLLRERFVRYLEGGTYGPGERTHPGARDRSDPTGWQVLHAEHQLRFGRDSQRWGGGVAFLDPEPASGRSILRCWNITVQQFSDVAAQENGMIPGDIDVDLADLTSNGHLDVTDRWYGRVLLLGRLEGTPVVTVTAARAPNTTRPGHPYLETIVRGLSEMGTIDHRDTVDYLLDAPGVDGHWAPGDVQGLTQRWFGG